MLEAVEGGTARHVVDLVRSAGGVRHEVAIPRRRSFGVTDESAVDAIRSAGGRVHWLPLRRSPLRPANLYAAAALRSLRRRTDAAVVHGHSSIGGALTRAAFWRSATPVVYTPNGIARGFPAIAVERLLAARTDRFVAVSRSEADLALALGLATPDRLAVVPNGIDLRPPPPMSPSLRSRLGLAPDVPLIGTISRLIEQKAPEQFVAVCDAVGRADPRAHFVLIGAGPLEAEVRARVHETSAPERFHLLGAVDGAAAALAEFDLFLLTSRFEGGPYSVLEAMRAGTPPVVSDVVGNRDSVHDLVTGRILPFGRTEAWAETVVDLLRDGGRRAEMAAAGVERLRRTFDVRTMGEATAAVYRDVAQAGREGVGRRATGR